MSRTRTTYHRDYQVGHDYEGLQRALESAYEGRRGHQLTPAHFEALDPAGAIFQIRFGRDALAQLSPPLETDWVIAPSQGSPRARVIEVDRDRDRILVACSQPNPSARFAQQLLVQAPDFLARLRVWLNDQQGRPLPSLFQRLGQMSARPIETSESAALQGMRASQSKALKAIGPGMHRLWGPPGTGKTFTLARMAASLLQAGYKIALLAPTNPAVDTAVLAIHAACLQARMPLERGRLVRAGVPRLTELTRHPELMAWQEVLAVRQRQLEALRHGIRELEIRLKKAAPHEINPLKLSKAQLEEQAREVRLERADELWRLTRGASILATTVYSALHREEMMAFFSFPKVAVLIDEAAMVARYALMPLLELLGGGEAPQGTLREAPTEVTIILAGDPRQLAPICQIPNRQDVNARYWLGESPMEDLLGESSPRGVSVLREQSRMDISICERISRTFYHGGLETVPDASRPVPPLGENWPDDGVVVLDARRACLPEDSPPEKSLRKTTKKDERSLRVAVGLIRRALAAGVSSVLWLSPFRDQALAAQKLVDTYFSSDNVRAGTVHSSQGGEADLVIFDPVSIRHRWLMGRMDGELDIERLLNVAVSRARGQVIVFTTNQDLSKNHLFNRLLHDAHRWCG